MSGHRRAARHDQSLARRAAGAPGAPVPGRDAETCKFCARSAREKASKENRRKQQEEGLEREGLRKYVKQLHGEFVASAQKMLRLELHKFRKSMLQEVASGALAAACGVELPSAPAA